MLPTLPSEDEEQGGGSYPSALIADPVAQSIGIDLAVTIVGFCLTMVFTVDTLVLDFKYKAWTSFSLHTPSLKCLSPSCAACI